MATENPLKLGLSFSNCYTIGPIWMKLVCILQPSIPGENGKRNHGNVNVDSETLLKGFLYLVSTCSEWFTFHFCII